MQKIILRIKCLGLEIKIPVIKVNEETYNYPIPRPIPKNSNLGVGNFSMNSDIQEFMDDIEVQIPNSLDGNLEQIAYDSLFNIMNYHIGKYGRILRTDLDSYIGQNILLFNAILEAQGKPMLTKEEQEERFLKFNYGAFSLLPESLKEIYKTNS